MTFKSDVPSFKAKIIADYPDAEFFPVGVNGIEMRIPAPSATYGMVHGLDKDLSKIAIKCDLDPLTWSVLPKSDSEVYIAFRYKMERL